MTKLTPKTRGLLLVAVTSIVVVNAILAVLPWTRFKPGDSTVTAAHVAGAAILFRPVKDNADSWWPMIEARDQVRRYRGGDGPTLYEKLFFKDKTKFQYAPTSLLFVEPVAAVSPIDRTSPEAQTRTSKRAFLVLQTFSYAVMWANVALVIGVFLAAGGVSGVGLPEACLRIAVAVALALTFFPAAKAMQLGQIQVWINALFSAAVLAWMLGLPRAAGVCIGLTCLMKPHYGLILVWGLVRRRWGFAISGLAVCAVGGLASLAMYGLDNHLDYLRVISYIGQRGESFHENQCAAGFLNRLLGVGNNAVWAQAEFPPVNPIVRWGIPATSLALIGMALFYRARESRASAPASTIDLLIAGLSFTMASPIAWQHHYGVMLPMFAVLFARVRGWGAVGLAVCWIVAGNTFRFTRHFEGTIFTPLQSPLLFAAIAMLVMLYAERRHAGPPPAGPW